MDSTKKGEDLHILDLPLELLDKILSYLCYENIAEIRLVSQFFNATGQRLLNKGFYAVDKYHTQCLKNIKLKLPRRESERKNHPLSRHCDILNTIETRISLLSMTYAKYIDLEMCCFIPGKVIDEINRILKLVETSCILPRAHELLQELRDISSMAMEHFDEKIVPLLKKKMFKSSFVNSTVVAPYHLTSSIFRSKQLPGLPDIDDLTAQRLYPPNSSTFTIYRKNMTDHKHKNQEMLKKIQEQAKAIFELNHIVTDLRAKVSEQDGRINEISRKLVEFTASAPVDPNILISNHQIPCMCLPKLRRSSRIRAKTPTSFTEIKSETNKRKQISNASETFTVDKKIKLEKLES